jgi:hypothetical protein
VDFSVGALEWENSSKDLTIHNITIRSKSDVDGAQYVKNPE